MIEASGLGKRFLGADGQRVRALAGVGLEVRSGEIVALVGPNGAGKTTLLKILATLVLPEEGEAWIGGASVLREPAKAKAGVGLLIADDRSFYPRLSVRRNLEFFAALHGYSAAQASERVERLARRLELERIDAAFQEQSAGSKQRAALARCLLGGPRCLLLDEPTRSLDPAAAAGLRRALREELRSGAVDAILFVTHQRSEAEELADRVVALEGGRLR